jgi:hypothetical protein
MRIPVHHPFLKPPLNPSNRRRGKKKQSKEEKENTVISFGTPQNGTCTGWFLQKAMKCNGTETDTKYAALSASELNHKSFFES